MAVVLVHRLYRIPFSPVHHSTTLEQIKADGEIRFAMVPGSDSFIPGLDEKPGIDYELAIRFADFLGVDASFHSVSEKELHNLLVNAKVHIAATPFRSSMSPEIQVAPPYHEASLLLVKNRQTESPLSINAILPKDLLLITGSQELQFMNAAFATQTTAPWSIRDLKNRDLLAQSIESKQYKFTVLPSNLYKRSRFYFPDISAVMELDQTRPVAWALRSQSNEDLYAKLTLFFQQIKQEGTLGKLKEKYYAHTTDLKYWDTQIYLQRINEILPLLKNYFIKAARVSHLNWQLLAAVGYQESHWDKNARSFTGVRGIMMLTKKTAKQMGVTDRMNIEQSILGGAKYLRLLLKKIPQRIMMPDRLWMALASYNIGYGHLEDARRLTEAQGQDPDQWKDVKKFLNLLSEEQWYKHTRYGLARGQEAVDYVENIQRYYDILLWRSNQSNISVNNKKQTYEDLFDSKTL